MITAPPIMRNTSWYRLTRPPNMEAEAPNSIKTRENPKTNIAVDPTTLARNCDGSPSVSSLRE
jgi:hypothetical protein